MAKFIPYDQFTSEMALRHLAERFDPAYERYIIFDEERIRIHDIGNAHKAFGNDPTLLHYWYATAHRVDEDNCLVDDEEPSEPFHTWNELCLGIGMKEESGLMFQFHSILEQNSLVKESFDEDSGTVLVMNPLFVTRYDNLPRFAYSVFKKEISEALSLENALRASKVK